MERSEGLTRHARRWVGIQHNDLKSQLRVIAAHNHATDNEVPRQLPVGHPLFMMGSSHLRLVASQIVEEWTVFDEVAVLAQAYRN